MCRKGSSFFCNPERSEGTLFLHYYQNSKVGTVSLKYAAVLILLLSASLFGDDSVNPIRGYRLYKPKRPAKYSKRESRSS